MIEIGNQEKIMDARMLEKLNRRADRAWLRLHASPELYGFRIVGGEGALLSLRSWEQREQIERELTPVLAARRAADSTIEAVGGGR